VPTIRLSVACRCTADGIGEASTLGVPEEVVVALEPLVEEEEGFRT
jgi:hypothetical protein